MLPVPIAWLHLAALLLLGGSFLAARGQQTFNRDVAPVLWRRCGACHRPGSAAPFSLVAYSDVVNRARLLAGVIRSGYMPPWPPAMERGVFVGDRSLTDSERTTVLTWLEGDLPEGEAADLPPVPEWADGWRLGKPDLVIAMPEQFEAPADGPDVFRNFAIPIPTNKLRYVRGFEFRPGNPRLVHHARILMDRSGRSARQDAADEGPGFSGGMAFDAVFDPDGHWLGWTPGKQPALRPPELAWKLAPGTDLVLELHLFPTGKPESIRSSVGLYFSDQPPTRTPLILRLGKNTIDIPAGEADYVIEDSFTLPADAQILNIYAHAHYLAKSVESWAELPDGTTVPLLRIDEWNFDWQDEYRYVEPVQLPKGATLFMRFRYDNSAANPRNPNDPPKRVLHGWKTGEEMGDLWLQAVANTPEDRAILARSYERKEQDAQIAGLELQLSADPNDVEKRVALGDYYLRQGRQEDARRTFEAALAKAPENALVHHNLGVVYGATGRIGDSLRSYRRAIALSPEHTPSLNNLAVALAGRGRTEEAATLLQRAIEIQPLYAEAYANLGAILAGRREVAEAMAVYREALAIDPGLGVVHFNLAELLRAAGDLTEARGHFEAAARSDYTQAARLAEKALTELDADSRR